MSAWGTTIPYKEGDSKNPAVKGGNGDWSTGMFEFFSDDKVFLYGVLCGSGLYIDTITKIYGGAWALQGLAQTIDEKCHCAGLVTNDHWGDTGFLCNGIISSLCGWIVYPLVWRPEQRQLYYIEGNLVGDCVTCICCGNCSYCQERREYEIAVAAKGKDFCNINKRKGTA